MSATTALPDRPRAPEKKGQLPAEPRPEGARHFVSPEEYLARERENEFKSEYVDGEMIEMPGASESHNRVNGNLSRHLGNALEGTDHSVYSSDMGVGIGRGSAYLYPDTVACRGEPVLADDHDDVLLNPLFIAEVLSPSTERYDRGKKFEMYRSADTLEQYLLLAQDRISARLLTRQPDGRWTERLFEDPSELLEIGSLAVAIPLAKIYDRVKMPAAAQPAEGGAP